MEISLLKCPKIGTFKVGFIALFLDAPSCFINPFVRYIFTRRTQLRELNESTIALGIKYSIMS